MNTIRLGLTGDRTTYGPGEEITGAALWELDAPPRSAELRLIWSTQGKGSQDIELVETVPFDAPQAGDTRPFRLRAPESPYSFSGKLISFIWALELVIEPGGHCERVELTIGPEGREVVIHAAE